LAHAAEDGIYTWLLSLARDGARVREQELAGGAVLSIVSCRTEAAPGEPLLEVENLVVHRGARAIIGRNEPGIDVESHTDGHEASGLSFVLRAGEIALLQAPNGWGKTTLLDALAGLIPVTVGSIRVRGRRVERDPPWERAQLGLSMLQARQHTFPNLTVRETLRLACGKAMKPPEHLRPLLDQKVSVLSGGQRQRAAQAASLGGGHAEVRLLDEPFSMLDRAAIRELQRVLTASAGSATLIAIPTLGHAALVGAAAQWRVEANRAGGVVIN
jgi:ABC-type branched-subunit amino acid transport system ATPase component